MADYYGVFEDGGLQSPTNFTALQPELTAHTMNATAFTNTVSLSSTYLNPADAAGNFAILSHLAILYADWFDDSIAADIAIARDVIYPIAAAHSGHVALLGWNTHDDAAAVDNVKLKIASDVFRECDPTHPASPMLVGGRNGLAVYDYVRPDMFLFYKNHFTNDTASCDLLNATRKYWCEVVREVVQLKPQDDPFHLLLQAHQTTTGPTDTQLRYPSLTEMSILFWEGLGEEADGLYWFTRSSVNDWLGLADRPTAYAQAAALGVINAALRSTLAAIERVPDRFWIGGDHYVATFRSRSNAELYYALVVHESDASGTLTVTSAWFNGTLRDVRTSATYALGASIPFAAGEGRLFVLDSYSEKTPPSVGTNLFTNPGFETVADGHPTGWTASAGSSADTDVFRAEGDGVTSLRIDGSGSGTLVEINQTVSLAQDTRYVMSFWLKGDNLDASLVGVDFRQITPSGIKMVEMSFVQSDDHDWRKFMAWFRTPTNNATNQARITATLKAGETVWYDDFSLYAYGDYFPDEFRAERLVDAPATTAPSIVQAPASQTITSGSSASLSVAVDGTQPFTYQWYEGESGDTGTPISGATSASYQTGALTVTTSYWVRVENEAGEADSAVAVVSVTTGTEKKWVFLVVP